MCDPTPFPQGQVRLRERISEITRWLFGGQGRALWLPRCFLPLVSLVLLKSGTVTSLSLRSKHPTTWPQDEQTIHVRGEGTVVCPPAPGEELNLDGRGAPCCKEAGFRSILFKRWHGPTRQPLAPCVAVQTNRNEVKEKVQFLSRTRHISRAQGLTASGPSPPGSAGPGLGSAGRPPFCSESIRRGLDPVLQGSAVRGGAQLPLSPSNSSGDWKIPAPTRSGSSSLLTSARKEMGSVCLFQLRIDQEDQGSERPGSWSRAAHRRLPHNVCIAK